MVDVAGRASHAIVRDALTVLVNLEHRGAQGSEANTGDGAGILLALPHGFLRAVAAEAGVDLPERGFAVAQVFLPRDDASRDAARERFEAGLSRRGPATSWAGGASPRTPRASAPRPSPASP